jgi:membrane associated rhomboid family serine protease
VFRFPPLTPFVRLLLIGLVASFVLTAVLQNFVGVPVVALLALNTTALSVATAWQVFTHVLVMDPSPNAVFQLLLSLLFLWWCLAPLEQQHGRTRAIQLTLIAAVSAALPALLVGLVLPGFAGLVGGPGAVTLAAIAAYVALLPSHAEMALGRLTIQPRHILWFNIALSFAGFLTTRNAAQMAADLGAIGGGFLFVRGLLMRPDKRPIFGAKRSSGGRLRLVKREDDDDDEPKRWLN